MLFNSLTFVVFFTIVMVLHRIPFSWRVKKINLMLASYIFYAAWNPPFVILLWISTIVDWFVAKKIYLATVQSKKRMFLIISILTNMGILGYFKYGGFLLENWQLLMQSFDIIYVPPEWDIVLPVGISFYTFQTMAYSLDIYLGRAKPAKSFLDFGLFVTFFPQLVAGPIVRPTHLIPQFETPKVASKNQIMWGLALITLGIFQKVVIADGALAPAVDVVYGAQGSVTFIDAWLGTFGFAGQIFSDFAGYSTAAIGVALCLGFSLPNNFNFPYAAMGFSDFWRRWHISLSSWLRDYLYVPLGGNRLGPIRTYVNLMLTMLIGGLWHGASWTFVVWGGLHGLYLAAERWLRGRYSDLPFTRSLWFTVSTIMLTYILINFTWVFFRAQDFPQAGSLVMSMLGMGTDVTAVLPTIYMIEVTVVTISMLLVHLYMRNRTLEGVVKNSPTWLLGTIWGFMLFTIIITQGSGDAFIYFQF